MSINYDEALNELASITDFIRWGASQMSQANLHFGHGTDNAIDEAAMLVLHALHLPPDLHQCYFDSRLTQSERSAVVELFQRRIDERIPAAYLTQRAWFMGLPFYVDERVLVPRSPMAEWINRQFQPWIEQAEQVSRVLDLCTGSGCIGIACAYAFPEAEVDISDISTDALAVAQRNIDDHHLADQVTAIRSDLFSELGDQRYDLIVSNPPYVGDAEMQALPTEFQREPELGLRSGEHGLDAVIEILAQASQHLTEQGIIVIEVGDTQHVLCDAFPDVPFVWLAFEHGGDGVFLLTANQLQQFSDVFTSEMKNHG